MKNFSEVCEPYVFLKQTMLDLNPGVESSTQTNYKTEVVKNSENINS